MSCLFEVISAPKKITQTQQQSPESPMMEFMYLVFIRMPGESSRSRLGSFLVFVTSFERCLTILFVDVIKSNVTVCHNIFVTTFFVFCFWIFFGFFVLQIVISMKLEFLSLGKKVNCICIFSLSHLSVCICLSLFVCLSVSVSLSD